MALLAKLFRREMETRPREKTEEMTSGQTLVSC